MLIAVHRELRDEARLINHFARIIGSRLYFSSCEQHSLTSGRTPISPLSKLFTNGDPASR